MTITFSPTLELPTTRLPPIGHIKLLPTDDLLDLLSYLRLIYNPEVRGSRRIDKTQLSVPVRLSGSPALTVDSIRSDTFERSYAIRWLTSLLAHTTHEALLQAAAALLALCAGTAAAGTITRTFVFGDVSVQLTDVPLDNAEFASVGAQTWGSACVLADMVAEAPTAFGLRTGSGRLRVLELGAGTGLVSLTLGKCLQAEGEVPAAAIEVVASDFHSTILANLRANIATNFPNADGALSVSAHFLDWSKPPSMPQSPFNAPFDVVFGADIIYAIEHAAWIKDTIERVLRKPGDGKVKPAQFHLLMPLRPSFEVESNSVEREFSAARSGAVGDGPVLGIAYKQVITCEADVGDAGEVDYVYYIIEWLAGIEEGSSSQNTDQV